MKQRNDSRRPVEISREVAFTAKRAKSARSERGFSLVELMIVAFLMSLAVLITAQFSQKWIQREAMRSASYLLQTHLQMARTQAVTRNRACRFQIDDATHEITLWDLNDPGLNSDDILITQIDFPDTVDFALPVSGSAITLNNLSGSLYETTFDGDGVVTSGSGFLSISAGDAYRRVSVYVAGGVNMEHWRNGAWGQGS